MIAASRLIFGALLASTLLAAGCTSGSPTKPKGPSGSKRSSGGSANDPTRATTPGRPAYPPPMPPDPFPHGRLIRVSIPGGASHFAARPTYVYLPPAAIATHRSDRRFPVLELFHGVPGDPSNWPVGGDVRGTMDAFAAKHAGVAPIVVMPDVNGAARTDTECVRTPQGGDVEQYLTVQVPRFVLAHYPASTDRRHWAVAGLSEGGLCALMLGLRAFPDYAAIGDFSGLGAPAVDDSTDPQRTVDTLFGGSWAAYDEHDPLVLLRRHRYPGLALWLFTGTADHRVASEQAGVAREAVAAGLRIKIVTMPGGHSWTLWMPALQRFLPWMWPTVGRGV